MLIKTANQVKSKNHRRRRKNINTLNKVKINKNNTKQKLTKQITPLKQKSKISENQHNEKIPIR